MGYDTITLENIEYYLVPKPIIMNLTDDVQIKFKPIKLTESKLFNDEDHQLKRYKVELKDWHNKEEWNIYVRVEYEDGTFKWEDWYMSSRVPEGKMFIYRDGKIIKNPNYNHVFSASDDLTKILENWYQKNIKS